MTKGWRGLPPARRVARAGRRRRASSTTTCPPRASASARSCVTTMVGRDQARRRSARKRRISRRSETSRAANGSSSRSARGRDASARASATRCVSPPESSAGAASPAPRRPRRAASRGPTAGARHAMAPRSRSRRSRARRGGEEGIALRKKPNPALLHRQSSPRSASKSGWSSSVTRPRLGLVAPRIIIRVWVFPAPFGPASTSGVASARNATSIAASRPFPQDDLENAHLRAPARMATSNAKAIATSRIDRLCAVRRSDSSAV